MALNIFSVSSPYQEILLADRTLRLPLQNVPVPLIGSLFEIKAVSSTLFPSNVPGHVAQSVGHLTHKSEVLGSVWPNTFVSPADSRRAVVNYWQKYVHDVLVYRLGGLRVGRKTLRN